MKVKIYPFHWASGSYSAPNIGCEACASSPTIILRERVITRINLYVLLHELGHHYWINKGFEVPCDREFFQMSTDDQLKRIREEIRAWGYVVRCIKDRRKYVKEILVLAKECLDGYKADRYCSWRKTCRLIKKDAKAVK